MWSSYAATATDNTDINENDAIAMAVVLRLSREPTCRPGVFFSRLELNQLLSLYSRHVVSGEWRDYAIDQRGDAAVFSIFRRSAERPLYAISKIAQTTPGQRLYVVSRGARTLRQGACIAEVLSVFDRRLRLVPSAF